MTDPTTIRTLKPAAQNPWYLLATLYGEAGWDIEIGTKNRVAWNRYYASQWTDEEREALKDRLDPAELVPFDEAELAGIRDLFRQRATGVQVVMPNAGQVINFQECQFDKDVIWHGYVFRKADFRGATFTGYAHFRSATFTGYAYFSSSTFTGHAYFSSATFTGDAYFNSATFTRNAYFDSATFTGHASFNSATFTWNAHFSFATFRQQVYFTNSELKAPTDFQNCRFRGEPPRFHGAKLHEGTVWRGVTWPTAPTTPYEAGRFTDAYERLKQEMDRLKKHEDELMFFAMELACRRVARGQIGGWPIGAYGVLCHYGQSYMLPLGWLVALILVGAVQFWPVLNWDFLLALGVSTANTLGPLGLRKEMMDAGTLPPDLSRWLRFLSGAQMVIGLILLFLIGLGLRNRFRMK